jgi:FtsP/CotA-like multicopper oxidase with cupredoxin domain
MSNGELFSTSAAGLPSTKPTETVRLADGAVFDLRIAPAANRLGDATVRMLAYNGSVPGPTLRVRQGSEISVRVRNDADHETTVHWHGLRLENRFDGVPHETQDPIPVGGEFTYRLQFPDDGLYWYHPHVREDYGLEMGLYGNIVVEPAAGDALEPVDREVIVTLDDVLMEDDQIAPFRVGDVSHTAMGRFGKLMLTAGLVDFRFGARSGEVVRFFFTNTANTRLFNVAIPGARMKLVGGDSGRYEREDWVEAVLLAPSERAIVDVVFPAAGDYRLEHQPPGAAYVLGSITVEAGTSTAAAAKFETLLANAELAVERAALNVELARSPDKTLRLVALMPILYGSGPVESSSWVCPMHPDVVSDAPGTCPKCGMQLVPAPEPAAWVCPMHPEVVSGEPGTCPKCGMRLVPSQVDAPAPTRGAHSHDSADGLEWEDLMVEINARTDTSNMIWKIVDEETGHENAAIDWSFRVGDRVKIRLVNTMDSEHPMHHPFHIHGAGRFLVIARDGVPATNLVWKDTVLVRAGETADIVLDVTNPGLWMAHCHIAEHNQVGMMFSFAVAAN